MIAPNNIHPPKNWQDFEMLCLNLWGEIWDIPDEIEFNSDNSQGQDGVDIYGPVQNGLKYNGIQCKNKKLNLIDGSPNRISISDIQAEIDKAKNFKPALNKLIIATSLPKDQKIEEYVRIKSVESVEAGLFSVQVCFWDFFERKLPEYPRIYDWYLKNENFHRISSATVVFSDGSAEQIYEPKFQKTIDQYILKQEEDKPDITSLLLKGNQGLTKWFELNNNTNHLLAKQVSFVHQKFDWKQLFWFKLRIINSGQTVIEDYKIELQFEGDFAKVGRESRSGIYAPNFRSDVHGYSNTKRSVYIKPRERILVQGDSYDSDYIYLEPLVAKHTEITVHWKLLSRDFEDNGKLRIKIDPVFHQVFNTHYVESADEEKEVTSFGLIKRPGHRHMLDGRIIYSDNDSDYTFVKL